MLLHDSPIIYPIPLPMVDRTPNNYVQITGNCSNLIIYSLLPKKLIVHTFILSYVGNFQIVNHGISQLVLDEAISVASNFFDLPQGEKLELMSNDVHKPVRYGSVQNGVDNVQLCRLFLKHYAHPLRDWIHMWPQNPPDYRYIYIYITSF